MHPAPHIRSYQAADAPDLADLLTLLGYPTDAATVGERFANLSPQHHTLVAESGNGIAGFIGLLKVQTYEHPIPIGYILAFSVSEAHQRQGIGRALLAAAEAYFRSEGITDIRVNSGLHREEAHRFYQAMGYQNTGLRFRKLLDADG